MASSLGSGGAGDRGPSAGGATSGGGDEEVRSFAELLAQARAPTSTSSRTGNNGLALGPITQDAGREEGGGETVVSLLTCCIPRP